MTPALRYRVIYERNLFQVSQELFEKEWAPALGIHPVLSRQSYISKKNPPALAVTLDLRVWATDALAEWIIGIKQRPF